MSVITTNDITLTYGAVSQAFTALLVDDDSFEIVSLPKKRLDWTTLENIIGLRKIYSIRIQQITQAQRYFLYNFIQSESQQLTYNGGSPIDVHLRDEQLALDLLDGYIGNVTLQLEFEDKFITTQSAVRSAITRAIGYTSNSVGFSTVANKVGTSVCLKYNYGDGETGRFFAVNSINFYKADIIDQRWEYIDKNRGEKKLGYKLNYEIDFGGFGLGQTQAQLQDDRDFIKEFVMAPSKYISGKGVYIGELVNDFDEVRYSLSGGIIYNKTTVLTFKSKNLLTELPVVSIDKSDPDPVSPSQLILDDPTYGTLDNHVLG